jgi:fatty-acyl-CoA synthase
MRFPGVGTWVERRAALAPEDVALVANGVPRSYGALASDVRGIASMLIRHGVRPGDRVAFHGVNHPVGLASMFATTMVGGVWVPVHPARPEDEVASVIEDAGARLLIRASPRTHPDIGVTEIEAAELGGLASDPDALPGWEPEPDDLAILAYTSGTTGAPKGVMVSHANLTWAVLQMLAACSFRRTDVALAAAPFTRMGGLGVTVLPTLFVGGSVTVPRDVDGSSVLETIERTGVTVLFANPDLLERVTQAPGWAAADLGDVRTGVVGGGLVPVELLRRYLDRGVSLRHGYGLTEASPVVSLLDERDAERRPESVGQPLPFVEVRATHPDGSLCAPGEVGEWWIRGPNVSAGYWRHPQVRDADGWFPTGDVGAIDAEGYMTFIDRASAAMQVSSGTVYPATIERALYDEPGVADAGAVDVDGRIMLGVVTSDVTFDVDALRVSLRTKLAQHEVPTEIHVVSAIPRNAAGKVLRDQLRRMLSTT